MEQNLKIYDFKLFELQEITIRKLTVLAGINSVGKSTIIQALLLLRTSLEERQKFGRAIDRYPIPLNGPFKLELGNTTEVIRRTKRIADSTMRISLADEGLEPNIDVIFSGDRATQTNYELWVEKHIFNGGTKGIQHPHFYYLCAERIGPRLKYEFEILPFPNTGYRGENTFQILSGENFAVPAAKCFDSKEPGFILSEARTWLDYIIPGSSFENAIAVGRSRVIEGTFGESLPTNVGFGISYVLPIIVDGLLAEPDSFFIVENPEAHLHPMGQSRIGKFLAQIAGTGVNVITETHSEHVINGIRISSLLGKIAPADVIVNYVSKKEENQDAVEKIDVTFLGDLTSYPLGFFDQEQEDISTLIIEKRKKL